MEIYEREIENTDKKAKVEGESSIQQDIVHVTNVQGAWSELEENSIESKET